MRIKSSHAHVIEQVPPNYYQSGIKRNFLQRRWHMGKLTAVLSEISEYPINVLDVGCASGWFLSMMKRKYPKAKYSGIEIYDKAVEYGRKKYPSINFKVSDAHLLPFPAKTFDLVICTEVLEHVDSPGLVIQEMKRVLKNNGSVVIELDSGSLLFSTVWFLWKLFKGSVWNDAHLHSFTIQKLEKLIEKSGMVVVSKKRFNLGMAMVFSVKKG